MTDRTAPAGRGAREGFNGTPSQPVSRPFTATNPSNDNHRLYNNDTPFRTNLDGQHTYVVELIGHLSWADLKYVGGYGASTYTQVSRIEAQFRFGS